MISAEGCAIFLTKEMIVLRGGNARAVARQVEHFPKFLESGGMTGTSFPSSPLVHVDAEFSSGPGENPVVAR